MVKNYGRIKIRLFHSRMQLAEHNTSALLLELFDTFILGNALCEVSLEGEEDEVA